MEKIENIVKHNGPPPTKREIVLDLLERLGIYVDEYTVTFDGKVYSMKKQ